MEPGFADLCDGGLLCIVRPDGEYLGSLHVTHLDEEQRFGAIVHFGPTGAADDSVRPPVCDQRFAATGHAGVPIHRLTLDELRAVERTGDPKVPFRLTILAE